MRRLPLIVFLLVFVQLVLPATEDERVIYSYKMVSLSKNKDTVYLNETNHRSHPWKNDTCIRVPLAVFSDTSTTLYRQMIDTMLMYHSYSALRMSDYPRYGGQSLDGRIFDYSNRILPSRVYLGGRIPLLIDSLSDEVLNRYGIITGSDSIVIAYRLVDGIRLEGDNRELSVYMRVYENGGATVAGPYAGSCYLMDFDDNSDWVKDIRSHFLWFLEYWQ